MINGTSREGKPRFSRNPRCRR